MHSRYRASMARMTKTSVASHAPVFVHGGWVTRLLICCGRHNPPAAPAQIPGSCNPRDMHENDPAPDAKISRSMRLAVVAGC
jgi:hypothetical protein